jgi:hypothetical protein
MGALEGSCSGFMVAWGRWGRGNSRGHSMNGGEIHCIPVPWAVSGQWGEGDFLRLS